VPAAFEPWRDRTAKLHPQLYRLIVDWSYLQPDPAQPANLAGEFSGCMRDVKPCSPFAGIKATMEAVAARQKQDPDDWAVEVVIYGVPPWAATAGGGCERPNIGFRSRAINAQGLAAYKKLIGDLYALGKQTGAQLRFWAPWNEPNQVFFISPQREKCDTSSPLISPGVYTKIFRAAKDELDALPGDQQLVLGELAGSPKKGDRAGTPAEFIAGLPKDVVCDSDVLGQHQYAGSEADAVAEAAAAADARGCGRRLPIWVTETGVGDVRTGKTRDTGTRALREQCYRYDRQLREWSRNPRVKVAVQYTVREDPEYRVGLVDAQLERAYPAFDLLQAWSNRKPGERPALAASCG
jgi:hypothetical protein